MTEEEIRLLDGPALAQLAYEYGVAPCSAVRDSNGTFWAEEGAHGQWVAWQPWEVLAQANAMFRQLRARRWNTFQGYDETYQFGHATAFKPRVSTTRECQWQLATGERGEAYALTLCTVLAVASEQGA